MKHKTLWNNRVLFGLLVATLGVSKSWTLSADKSLRGSANLATTSPPSASAATTQPAAAQTPAPATPPAAPAAATTPSRPGPKHIPWNNAYEVKDKRNGEVTDLIQASVHLLTVDVTEESDGIWLGDGAPPAATTETKKVIRITLSPSTGASGFETKTVMIDVTPELIQDNRLNQAELNRKIESIVKSEMKLVDEQKLAEKRRQEKLDRCEINQDGERIDTTDQEEFANCLLARAMETTDGRKRQRLIEQLTISHVTNPLLNCAQQTRLQYTGRVNPQSAVGLQIGRETTGSSLDSRSCERIVADAKSFKSRLSLLGIGDRYLGNLGMGVDQMLFDYQANEFDLDRLAQDPSVAAEVQAEMMDRQACYGYAPRSVLAINPWGMPELAPIRCPNPVSRDVVGIVRGPIAEITSNISAIVQGIISPVDIVTGQNNGNILSDMRGQNLGGGRQRGGGFNIPGQGGGQIAGMNPVNFGLSTLPQPGQPVGGGNFSNGNQFGFNQPGNCRPDQFGNIPANCRSDLRPQDRYELNRQGVGYNQPFSRNGNFNRNHVVR
jgi:hypothetical protein